MNNINIEEGLLNIAGVIFKTMAVMFVVSIIGGLITLSWNFLFAGLTNIHMSEVDGVIAALMILFVELGMQFFKK